MGPKQRFSNHETSKQGVEYQVEFVNYWKNNVIPTIKETLGEEFLDNIAALTGANNFTGLNRLIQGNGYSNEAVLLKIFNLYAKMKNPAVPEVFSKPDYTSAPHMHSTLDSLCSEFNKVRIASEQLRTILTPFKKESFTPESKKSPEEEKYHAIMNALVEMDNCVFLKTAGTGRKKGASRVRVVKQPYEA
jgi:hypothetical protein